MTAKEQKDEQSESLKLHEKIEVLTKELNDFRLQYNEDLEKRIERSVMNAISRAALIVERHSSADYEVRRTIEQIYWALSVKGFK